MALISCSAIVAARDQKLRELFAVASCSHGQSHDGLANADAQPSTQALEYFLQANDILQYVWAIDLTYFRTLRSAFVVALSCYRR